MRHPLFLVLAAALGACAPKPITEVTLSGTVFDGPDSVDGIPDATIEVRNAAGRDEDLRDQHEAALEYIKTLQNHLDVWRAIHSTTATQPLRGRATTA